MVLQKILRAGEGKIVRRLSRIADHVETLEGDVLDLTDAELRARTDQFKERYTDGESLDDLLPDAFATVREAAKRTLGQRHYKVQLMGGAAMHLGNVAEMRTGEGKTLAATLPAYLNALSGDGVHIVTVNDYLVQRDAEWMGRVHRFLGLEVGVILANERPAHRRVQYGCDITYGTNNEFGFDYLRDNMAWSAEGLVQRGHNFGIVDEVDSILIDEARTPLIISGPAEQSAKWYAEFARIAPILKRDRHYEVEEGKRTVAITEDGVSMVEDQLGIENLYEAVNTPLIGYLNNALKAKEIFRKDRDYIVTEGEVLIVDEFTGRVLSGRRYNEGLHQAIEAKEKVAIKDENQTLATITLQNYFRLYERLGGMTGTASTEAAELHQTYGLGVVPIPTNKDMVRKDQADIIYKTESAKFDSVVDDITDRHAAGQPILVGTASVEKSELLSKLLRRAGVPHEVLNAKNHAREAAIIAMAGRTGSVTVATNMAGRGTDIVLGGNPEFLADLRLRQQDLTPTDTPDEYEAAWDRTLEEAQEEVEVDHEDVVEAGGLYVLGTERHESRRIDNQLRGRAGRQGDPGESRFYLSLGDDLMVRANGAAIESMMDRLRMPDDVPIESKIVSRAIQSAQTQVEQQNFEIRKRVLKYDEVMNRQREVIYAERDKVLGGADLEDQVRHMLDDVVGAYITGATETGYAEEWDLEQLWTALGQLYPVGISLDDLVEEAGGDVAGVTAERLTEAVTEDIQAAYDTREEAVTADLMRELERRVLLTVMDRKWREHLYEMDYLREGIHLRAMANRDPVVEYQREGYDMFATMLDGIQEEAVGFLFNVEVKTKEEAEAERRAAAEAAAAKQQTSSATQQSNGAAPETGTAARPVKTAGPGANAAAPAKAAAKAVPKNANRATRRKAGVRAGTGAAPATGASNGAGTPAAESRTAPDAAKSTDTARDKVPALAVKGLAEPKSVPLTYSAPTLDGGTRKGGGAGAAKTATVSGTTTQSRNSPCACGSGKKFKHCHGARG